VGEVVGRIGCVAVMVVGNGGCYWIAEVVGDMSMWWEWVGVVLLLPLSQQCLVSLLLLAKDIDSVLRFYMPYPLFVNVLSVRFGALSDCLPSHDGFLLLLEPLYLLLYPDQLFILCCSFVLFCFLIPVLH
jgi:hypothetical protein